jgi:hypothetical protein
VVTVHQPSGLVSAPAYFLVTAPVTSMGFGALEVNPIVLFSTGDTQAADFNGDGNADALLNQGNSMLVALGNGDGSTQPPIQYNVSGTSSGEGGGTTVADFNNDGFPDLAFPVSDPFAIQIMLDNSAGALSTGPQLNLSSRSFVGVNAAADFNGDGKLDLVFATNGSVGIALGNGDGTFQTPTYISTIFDSYSVAVGDFNRDGIPDIAAGLLEGDGVAIVILIGNGDGTFAPPVSYTTTMFSRLVSADLNGDGFPDLVGVDANGYAVDVMLNSGNGTFLPAVSYSGPGTPSSTDFGALAVGDMNGDGKLDVVALNTAECTNNCIEIFPGNGDGTLQTGTYYGIRQNIAGISGGEIALADFSHDGKLDITAPWTQGSYLLVQTAGPAPTLVPGVFSFPSTAVGSESQPLSTELYQPGSTAITVFGATVTGDFVMWQDGCENFVLQPGNSETCFISVAFQPTTTGVRTGSLIITSSGGTQNLFLSGTATAAINVQISPTSLSFGTESLNGTTNYFSVNISNIGSQTVDFIGITIVGANPGDFLLNNLCGSTLGVGANCNVQVAFRPTAQGVRAASLSIADNAANSPQTVPLSGIGNALHISTNLLNFGNVTVGTSSSLSLTLRNLGSTRSILISQIKFLSNAADYSQTNNCNGSIAPRSNCTMTVTFSPQTQGQLNSVLTFSSNGTGTQTVTSITLKGRGE